jgi:hypothetical protein
MAKARSMNRSRNQLATSYAPGSFFTFEGGVGACMATPITGEPITLAASTTRMILERLEQFSGAWFERAMNARNDKPEHEAKFPIVPELCVDVGLLNDERTTVKLPLLDTLYFSKPSNMGYTPAPLTFTCRYCGMFREFSSLRDMEKGLAGMQGAVCDSPRALGGKCSWEQLDVIFVHWSGGWEQASPSLWDFRDGRTKQNYANCQSCGSRDFKLNRSSPKIGDWYFHCAKCGTRRGDRWMQRDRETLDILRTTVGTGRLSGPTEVNMEATPYRANNAYYIQSDLFIDFQKNEGELTRWLAKDAEDELRAFIAGQYGFATTPLTDADVEQACQDKPGLQGLLAQFQAATKGIAGLETMMATADEALKAHLSAALAATKGSKRQIIDTLREQQILTPAADLPADVSVALRQRRQLFDSRFDPFQLAIEHEMLTRARLNVDKEYVSFKHLDADLSPETPEEKVNLEAAARERLSDLGIADMGLIKKFDLCRFSFGYSRVSSQPVLQDKRNMNMPVRLRLFDRVRDDDRSKYPIYVVQQANQAIYVKLDPEAVMGWLGSLNCLDPIVLEEGQRPGAGILARTVSMRRFLDGMTELPQSYLYLYTLLHSYAHHVIKQVSGYSGLDVGSLGEYLFPADLAFVIYRNSTTMDLGNLSAMWRNSGRALLDSLLDPRSLQCGTGSLCTTRGSACPDCQMIPEVSCLTSNKLLSRSVLRSIGGRPSFDKRGGEISGYLDWLAGRKKLA